MILKDDKDIIHRQIQLLNAQIPYSFYVINYTNQIFRYKLGVASIVSVNIPVGNYTANSLITAIKAAVNDVNFLITISSINGKLTFTYNTSFIIYNNFTYSIGSILGFDINSTNNSVTNAITPTYPLNLLGIKTLQIRSNNLSCSNISSVEGGQTSLLATIPVDCTPFGMINYKDLGNNLITISNTFLDDLDLDIIDGETGAYINFNNQDWCITLAIHITKVFEPINRTTFNQLFQPSTEAINPPLGKVEPKPAEIKLKENKNLEELNLLTN
jgi:hypothetical protein